VNVIKKVAQNISIIIVGRLLSKFASVAAMIYLSRYLGSARLGKYSVAYAYLYFFNILTSLGIDSIVVREISKDNSKADKLLGNSITMKLVLSLFTVGVSWVIVAFIDYPSDVSLLIYVASFSLLSSSFQTLYQGIFQVYLDMKYPVLVMVVMNFLLAGLTAWLIVLKAQLISFVVLRLIVGFPGLIALILLWALSHKYVRPRPQIDLSLWKELLYKSWPIALTSVFTTIYFRIDQIMLFKMVGENAVGYYSAAVRLTEFLNVIPGAFMVSVFPLFSKYFVTSGEKLDKAYKLSFKCMTTIITPIAMGTTILAKPIIEAVYGHQFYDAFPVLQILIWSQITVSIGAVMTPLIISVDLQKLIPVKTFPLALVNVLLNFILIPRYGIVGAAIASTISYVLGVPLSYSLRENRKFAKAAINSMVKPALASIPLGIFVYFSPLPLLLTIFVSVFIYLASIISIGGLNSEDFRYFRQVVAKKGKTTAPEK